jgi:hypothetical protein
MEGYHVVVVRRGIIARLLGLLVAFVSVLGITATALAAPPQSVLRHDEHHAAFPFYDCGDFTIQAEWDVTLTFTQYFAADGSPKKFVGHVAYVGTLSHPSNGRWVDDRGVHTFVDDQLVGQTHDAGGYRKITAPGEGILVHDTGLAVIGWNDPENPFDDSFLRLAGPKDELEGKTDAICAYLRG